MDTTQGRSDALAFAKLAATHLNQNQWDEAEAAALLGTRADATSFECWLALAVARARRGDHSLAIAPYLQALALKPDDIGAWTDLGEVYLALLRHDEAAAALKHAIALDPEAKSAPSRRARAVVGRTLSGLKKGAR